MSNNQFIGIMVMLGMLIGVGVVNIVWLTIIHRQLVLIYLNV